MDTWKIRDNIRSGVIEFKIDDIVVLFRRKGKNPRSVVLNKDYIVVDKDENTLLISCLESGEKFKIHKTYMVPKSYLRDTKIERIIKKSQ